jgi:hypothetical protein
MDELPGSISDSANGGPSCFLFFGTRHYCHHRRDSQSHKQQPVSSTPVEQPFCLETRPFRFPRIARRMFVSPNGLRIHRILTRSLGKINS